MEMPDLGYLIFIVAAILSLIIQILQNKLVDVDKRDFYMKELNKWRAKYMQARKTGDPKLLAEVQKEYPRIQLIQAELSKEMMKGTMASMFTTVIFLVMLYVIGRQTIVIIAPLYIPIGFLGSKIEMDGISLQGFNLIWWYFIAALPSSSLISNVIKVFQVRRRIIQLRKKIKIRK